MKRLILSEMGKSYGICEYLSTTTGREMTVKYYDRYDVPTPPSKLRHKPLMFKERVENLIMFLLGQNKRKCCVCGRREIYTVRQWRIVGCTCNNKIGLESDHDWCDIEGDPIIVCNVCVTANYPIFEPVDNLQYLAWKYEQTL